MAVSIKPSVQVATAQVATAAAGKELRDFITPYRRSRGVRAVQSLLWYKDRLLAGVGPIDGGLYDALTGELIAPPPYDYTEMSAKLYHAIMDIVLIGPFVYDGQKVRTLPATPYPDSWEVYWYAPDPTDPNFASVFAGTDDGIWRIDLNTLTATKYADYWYPGYAPYGGVTKVVLLIVFNISTPDLWAYDIVNKSWVDLYSGVNWMSIATLSPDPAYTTVALGYVGNQYLPRAYAVGYPDALARSVSQVALLPREVQSFDRLYAPGWIAHMDFPIEYLGCIGNELFLLGDMRSGEASVEYIGTLPFHASAAETIGNILALGSSSKTYMLSGTEETAIGTDVGTVTFLRIGDLSKIPKRPAVATIWSSESVPANTYSLPVVVNGWSRRTLMFTSDTAGTLTIEVDMVGDGDWKTYDTINVSANTPMKYMFTGGFAKLRLSFNTAATVTAKLYVEP